VRRLCRILLHVATVVSLVLSATATALWVRGHWAADQLVRGARYPSAQEPPSSYAHTRKIVSSRGGVMFEVRLQSYAHVETGFRWARGNPFGYPAYEPAPYSSAPVHRRYAAIGFEVVVPRNASENWPYYLERTRSVTVPLWAVILATGILPALWLRSVSRRAPRALDSIGALCGLRL
jgi:hypothetical protein